MSSIDFDKKNKQTCFCLGSVVVSFVSGSDATNLASAVETISNNPDTLSDMSVKSININGQTYSVASSKSDTTSQSSDTTAMIVIIVVGLVGSVVIVLVAYLIIQYYDTRHVRQPLINENIEMKPKTKRIPSPNQIQPLNQNNDRTTSSTVSVNMLNFQSTK